MKRFVGKLDLTKEQEAKMDADHGAGGPRRPQIRKTTWTTSQAVMDRASAEVGAVLEQKVKFERIQRSSASGSAAALGERMRRGKDAAPSRGRAATATAASAVAVELRCCARGEAGHGPAAARCDAWAGA